MLLLVSVMQAMDSMEDHARTAQQTTLSPMDIVSHAQSILPTTLRPKTVTV